MDKRIDIGLAGHPGRFDLDEPAYDRLNRYLDRAARRLEDDPDRAEVLADLERSVGDKLTSILDGEERTITLDDIDTVLDAIGVVETGREPAARDTLPRPRRRRLQRIREGQELAGVCTGIAAYAEVDVSWVRTVVVLGTLFTGGILGLVYIALVLILPVVPAPEA